jgi:hypothetical protein
MAPMTIGTGGRTAAAACNASSGPNASSTSAFHFASSLAEAKACGTPSSARQNSGLPTTCRTPMGDIVLDFLAGAAQCANLVSHQFDIMR